MDEAVVSICPDIYVWFNQAAKECEEARLRRKFKGA